MKIAIPLSTSKTQYYINQAYVDYIAESENVPVPTTNKAVATDIANECGGLILPGGIDVDPVFYGESNRSSYSVDPAKDDFERQLFYAFTNLGKPVLGICRGFQLIVREYILRNNSPAVQKRLRFAQHVDHHSLSSDLEIQRDVPTHGIIADRNVMYNEEHGTYQKMFVNSMHHQCLILKEENKHPGKNGKKGSSNPLIVNHLRVLALTRYGLSGKRNDDIVEAFDITGWTNSYIMAVQWHPEELKDHALLNNFFNAEDELVEAVQQ